MAVYGGKREGAGRPSLLSKEQWNWCRNLILEMQNEIERRRFEDRLRRRDERGADERQLLEDGWAQLHEIPLSERPRVITFVERLQKAAHSSDHNAYDEILAEAAAISVDLAKHCRLLIRVNEELVDECLLGDVPRRRPYGVMRTIFEVVAEEARKRFGSQITWKSIGAKWNRESPSINRAKRLS